MSEIILPEVEQVAVGISPKTLLIYGKPKAGKTTIISKLPGKWLIADLEGGSNFIGGFIYRIDTSKSNIEQGQEFEDMLRAVYKKGYDPKTKDYKCPYDGIVVDTITALDMVSEDVGTIRYMNSVQGAKFNRSTNGDKINSSSDDWSSVHDLANGFGYRWSRNVMLDYYTMLTKVFPRIILIGHTKDRFVAAASSGEPIATKEIALTGKLRDIISSKMDTIGLITRDKNKLNITFTGEAGSRCNFLSGKTILLGESNDKGEVTANWKQIFTDL